MRPAIELRRAGNVSKFAWPSVDVAVLGSSYPPGFSPAASTLSSLQRDIDHRVLTVWPAGLSRTAV